MFDFVYDLFAESDYDEIECLVSELEGLAETGREALRDMEHTIKYSWTNERWGITREGVKEIKCRKNEIDEDITISLLENEIYDFFSDLYEQEELEQEEVDYDDYMDKALNETEISWSKI